MARTLHIGPIRNFRDLGGYQTPYGETHYGIFYRGGELSGLNKEELDALHDLGIKTVIDLRDEKTATERPDSVKDDQRFAYFLLPVNGNGRVPTNRADMFDSYFEMIEEPKSACKIFRTLLQAEKPLYFHCAIGKDRTGVIAFLILMANGVALQDANADYLASYSYIDDLVEMAIEQKNYPEDLIDPETLFMVRFYREFLKRYGSLDEYFASIGLNEDEVNLTHNLLGRQEKSCGAVTFLKEKILVEHMKKGHWSIPKGHVEACDKNEYETAIREIREETGLYAELIPGFRKRVYYSPKKGRAKEVVFFMANVFSTAVQPQAEEVTEIRFVEPEEAIALLTHPSDRGIVEAALEFKRRNQK
jgi:protein-tyrosine phosphatase